MVSYRNATRRHNREDIDLNRLHLLLVTSNTLHGYEEFIKLTPWNGVLVTETLCNSS